MTALSLRVGNPSIGGTLPLWVGKRRYGVPPGSRIVHVQGRRLAYVATPDGKLAAFLESGQIFGIPPELGALIRAHYFPNEAPTNLPGQKIR